MSSARRHRRHTAEAILTDDAERLRALREAAAAGMAAFDRGQYVEHVDAPSLRAHLLRILHDGMDLARHAPPVEEG